MDRNRDSLADLLKGYACLLVLVGHVILGIRKAGLLRNASIEIFFEEYIWSFHVALFAFLSGYVYNITNGWKSKDGRGTFILHKLLNLGVPYVAFSVLYIGINSVVPGVNNKSELKDILFIWRDPVAQYWFIYALFFLFVIWTCLSKIFNNVQITILFVCIALVSGFFNFSWGCFSSTVSLAIPFGLGTSIKDIKFPKISNGVRFIIIILHIIMTSFCVIYAVNDQFVVHILLRVFGIFSSVMFISLISKAKIVKTTLLYVNKYSFPIYLLHTIFTAGIRVVLKHIGIVNVAAHIIIGTCMGLVMPVLIAIIASKIPIIDFFFYPSKNLKLLHNKMKA